MASEIKLQFNGPGVVGENFAVFSGANMIMVTQRQGFGEVTKGDSASDAAMNFYQAFNLDHNYTNQFTVNLTFEEQTEVDEFGNEVPGEVIPIVTIEHPDNTKFDTHLNNTSNITSSVTTTAQEVEPTLNLSLVAGSSPCSNYKLIIETNVTAGVIVVEHPVGNLTDENVINLDGSASYEVERVKPSELSQGIVKLKDSLLNNRSLVSVLFYAPTVLSISSVKIEGSPFGAAAIINVSNGQGRSFSLDNVTFQGSNTFPQLPAGNYTAYVKDSVGCTKSKTFVITEDQASGITVSPMIRIPVHNSLHFVKRGGNSLLNYLSTEMPGYVQIFNYFQEYLKGDSIRTQFKSSYEINRAFLIDENETETELTVIKKSNNISRINIYEGNYTDKEGRLAIYFTSGEIYNEDLTPKAEGHLLNGTLPDWYEEGMYVNVEGIGVTRIDRKMTDEDGTIYAITQTDAKGPMEGIKITSIHTAHPWEIYEFDTLLPEEGIFQVRVDYGEGFFLSELIRVNAVLPANFMLVQWWNKVNNDIQYSTGIKHFRRLEWEQYFTLKPRAEKETYDTDTTVELTNSKTFAVYELTLEKMPMEPARGLQVGFDNSSTIVINGAVFLCEPPVKLDPKGQWYYPSMDLTLIDQTMDGQQVINDAVIPEFLAVDINADGVVFLRL